MKATLFRALCRMRSNLLARKFFGQPVRPWHRVAVKVLEVPIEIIACFDLRQLWRNERRKAYRTTWPVESAARPGHFHDPGTQAFLLEKVSEEVWLVELVGAGSHSWYDSVEMDPHDLQEM